MFETREYKVHKPHTCEVNTEPTDELVTYDGYNMPSVLAIHGYTHGFHRQIIIDIHTYTYISNARIMGTSRTFSYPRVKLIGLGIKPAPISAGINSHPNPHLISFLLVGTQVKYVGHHLSWEDIRYRVSNHQL